jgi:hypothetical protein
MVDSDNGHAHPAQFADRASVSSTRVTSLARDENGGDLDMSNSARQPRVYARRDVLVGVAATIAAALLAACGRSTPASQGPSATATDLLPTPPIAAATTTPTVPPDTAKPGSATPAASAVPVSTMAPAPPAVPAGTTTPIGGTPATTAIYDVRQFGATGDGRTDDTAAIQAAIDASPATGGTVMLPPGIYIVAPTRTKGIDFTSNLRVIGAGERSVIKIKDHAGNWQRLFAPRGGASVENVSFEDLSFDANIRNNPEATINEKDDSTYQTFISATAGRNLSVRRCRFNPYSGVWAISFNGKTIRDCAVTDCSFTFVMRDGSPDYDNSAVYIEGSNYTMSGNHFQSMPLPLRGARACMEAHGGPAEVFNNTSAGYQTIVNIVGSYFPGGSPGDITCHDNVATDALLGIMLWPTTPNNLKNVSVTNNTITLAQTKHGKVETSGIYILFSYEAKGQAANITITGNRITFADEGTGRSGDFYYNSSGIGLHNLGGVSGVTIEGNTIDLAPSAGVLIGLPEPGQRAFENVRVANNTIVNAGQNLGFPAAFRAGILVNSSASGLSITGNTIADHFPAPRCPAGIAFDLSGSLVYKDIAVQGNTSSALTGPLPVRLPSGVRQSSIVPTAQY